MKILWAKANKLLPLHSGGDIRSFQILKHLSATHEVTFLSYYDGPQDKKYEAELTQHFPRAVSIFTGGASTFLSRGGDYLRRLPSQAPYAVSRFASPSVQAKVNELLRSATFDIAVADFLDAVINFPQPFPVPAVLFQHNVESEIWRRHASTETNPAKRVLYMVEYKKMMTYEKAAVRRFDHVIAVSQHDRELMKSWTSSSRITVVPTGVDLNEYHPDTGSEPSRVVMFVGAMDWEPNIDGVEFFRQEMWDIVLTQIPEAKFFIVGRNPDRRIQKLASGSTQVTGRVDSVYEYLRKAAVVVVPLRIGGGTRLKIYEAMAAGKAVVSTTVGAEGLDVAPGKDIVIADSPQTFAEAVVRLLKDRELRRSYEAAAAETASKYGWPVVAAKFGKVLEEVAVRSAKRK